MQFVRSKCINKISYDYWVSFINRFSFSYISVIAEIFECICAFLNCISELELNVLKCHACKIGIFKKIEQRKNPTLSHLVTSICQAQHF